MRLRLVALWSRQAFERTRGGFADDRRFGAVIFQGDECRSRGRIATRGDAADEAGFRVAAEEPSAARSAASASARESPRAKRAASVVFGSRSRGERRHALGGADERKHPAEELAPRFRAAGNASVARRCSSTFTWPAGAACTTC